MNLQFAMQVMGIHHRVTKDELKSIYRRKAVELHPDTNKNPNAAELFKNLNSAYKFLETNLEIIKPAPKAPPTGPSIFRMLDSKQKQNVNIPVGSLKDNDLCVYFMWRGNEYRITLKKGTTLPMDINITGTLLNMHIVEFDEE